MLFSRYSLGRVEAIEIEYVGTTDLTFWLSTKYALVPAILIFYNQILDAVDRTIKTLTALQVMKDAGHGSTNAPSDAQIIEDNASKLVKAFIEKVSAGTETAQLEELTGGITVSAKLLIEDVLKGTRLQVEYSRDVVTIDNDQHINYGEEKVKSLLAENAALELKIAEYTGKDRILLPPDGSVPSGNTFKEGE